MKDFLALVSALPELTSLDLRLGTVPNALDAIIDYLPSGLQRPHLHGVSCEMPKIAKKAPRLRHLSMNTFFALGKRYSLSVLPKTLVSLHLTSPIMDRGEPSQNGADELEELRRHPPLLNSCSVPKQYVLLLP